jgi:uncharacterized protein YutE (UPF0331/DUF86 family)
LNPESLDKQLIQDAFVLNVQRATQAAIDMASWVCKDKKLGIPDTYKKSFELLFQHDFIDAAVLHSMKSMCGFRNIAIHEYKKINVDILKSILTKHLIDLEKFYQLVINLYDSTKQFNK